MLAGNVGAMIYYMLDNSINTGISMLGTATALSSIMGVTLTAAIGGREECVLQKVCIHRMV